MKLRITVLAVALAARAAAAASHADLFIDLQPLPARLPASRPLLSGAVRNNGPDAAENVVVVATASNGQHLEIPVGTVNPIGGQPFTLTFPASDAEFRLEVRVSSTTPDPDSVNDAVSGTVQITSAPDLSVSLTTPTADPGRPAVYELRLLNLGSNDASQVTFTLPLDGGWAFGQSFTAGLQCSATPEQARCTVGTVAAGETFFGRFALVAPNRREGEMFHIVPLAVTSDAGIFRDARAVFGRGIYRHIAVTSTADDGDGSLRKAIIAANASPFGCKIDFDIALGGGERVATIRPLTPLPTFTTNVNVYVDGSTQRAAHGDTNPDGPEIEINGSHLSSGGGLQVDSRFVEIREIVVNGFPGNGITGASSVIGCYVGTDPSGRHAVPNGGRGLSVNGLSVVRNSVISGNARSGIFAASGTSISIVNNRIGVAAGDELLPLGNGASGIYFGALVSESAITGNVIGFNRDAGVGLDLQAEDITISANSIASNGGLPIDYGIDGVTPNGPPLRDQPPFPLLTAARYDAATGRTTVDGHIDVFSFIGVIDRLELFASDSGEPRQALQFLGRLALGPGNGKDFHFEWDGDLRGRFITATYTRPSSYYPELTGSRTSELSDPIAVAGAATTPLRRIPRGADLTLGFGGPFTIARLHAGEPTTISVSGANLGPEPASDVVLTIDIKGTAGVRLGLTSNASCQLTGNERIVCRQQQLAAGESFLSSLTATAPLTAGTIEMFASLTSSGEDFDRSNNAGKITIDVSDAPTLALNVQSPGATEPGTTAVFNVLVRNVGHLPVNDLTLTDPLRTGWSFVRAEGGGWQCTADVAKIVCTRPELEPQDESAFNLVLRAPQTDSGQRRDVTLMRLTASKPLAFDAQAYLVTEVTQIFRVTSTADVGAGTLRDVIRRANATCTLFDTLCKAVFELPAPVPPVGYYSIRPTTPLPAITSPLMIDATTQSQATGDTNPLGPEVELSGVDTATGNGLLIHTRDVAGVRGLAINRFPENGIAIDELTGGNFGLRRVIADCYIGTDPTGRTAAPNGRGIGIAVPAQYFASVDIVDNVISGNARSGIFFTSGVDVLIAGNRIGVAAGEPLAPLGNGASGIYTGSSVIDVQADDNVIAFNRDVGVGSDNAAVSIGLQRNALFGNGHLAIDYGLDGVTFNDSASRPALLPQFPVITSAVWDAASGVTRIEGVAPPSSFVNDRGVIDLYRNSAPDPSAFGPAEEWIGEAVVEFSHEPRPFALQVPRNLQGSFVAATFTRTITSLFPSRWTSELSSNVSVTPSR